MIRKYTFLILILLPFIGIGQVTSKIIEGKQYVIMEPIYAGNVEFWGHKGILSVPLIDTLSFQVKLLKLQLTMQDQVNTNLRYAQEEYRTMVATNVSNAAKIQEKLLKAIEERDKFKEKARRRGAVIATGTTVLAAITALIIFK